MVIQEFRYKSCCITLQNKGIPVISKYRDNEDSCILRIIKMVMPHKKKKKKKAGRYKKRLMLLSLMVERLKQI